MSRSHLTDPTGDPVRDGLGALGQWCVNRLPAPLYRAVMGCRRRIAPYRLHLRAVTECAVATFLAVCLVLTVVGVFSATAGNTALVAFGLGFCLWRAYTTLRILREQRTTARRATPGTT